MDVIKMERDLDDETFLSWWLTCWHEI